MDTIPAKTGQLWEECERCGKEPIYMPLHLCEDCWPGAKSAPRVHTHSSRSSATPVSRPTPPIIDMPLPALTGSTKQIAWAKDIRARKIAEMAQADREAIAPLATKAKFWIEKRNHQTREIITVFKSLIASHQRASDAVNAMQIDRQNITIEQSKALDDVWAARAKLDAFFNPVIKY